jgi:mycothiol system anti-sigma-R factor
MSCGKPHETPCTEVLALVYSYIDNEMEITGTAQIAQHLEECGPCLREYGLEQLVIKLVHKCCGDEAVPGELRTKVLSRIAAVRKELEDEALAD